MQKSIFALFPVILVMFFHLIFPDEIGEKMHKKHLKNVKIQYPEILLKN